MSTGIKVTAAQLMNSQQALNNLSRQQLPVKASYWVGKVIGQLSRHAAPWIKELDKAHTELVLKYGTEDAPTPDAQGILTLNSKGTGTFTVTEDNMEIFQAAMKEIMEEERELDVVQLGVELLSEAKMSPQDMNTLSWLIKPE